MTIRSPRFGRLFPPPRELASPVQGTLPPRRGTPLDPANLRCTLETGTYCGLIGDPDRLGAVMIVDQTDVSEIIVGTSVKLWVPQSDSTLLSGTVLDIAANDLKLVPREFSTNVDIAAHTDAAGAVKPRNASYRVRVSLSGPCQLPAGTQCRGKIKGAPMSLLQRTVRFAQRTFRFGG